jgi:hypothetical protein
MSDLQAKRDGRPGCTLEGMAHPIATRGNLLAAALLLMACGGTGGHAGEVCEEGPLLESVRDAGSVRVIVLLHVEEHDDVDDRRTAIALVQDAVLAELDDAGGDYRVNHRYGSLAMLALTVDEVSLCRLMASDHVDRVEEDSEDGTRG